MDKEQLISKAVEVLDNSYAPYSQFPVAAAILMKDGNVVTGVNVENASFGATNCAERTAIFTAITNGYKVGDFMEIAIVSNLKRPIPPCGICRQVLSEFFPLDAKVHMSSQEYITKTVTVLDLLPYNFSSSDLKECNV